MTKRNISDRAGNGQAPHDTAIQPPPHDVDAERGCLCAALTSDDLRRVVLDRLDLDSYYIHVHGAIHGAIRGLDGAGRAVDAVTVADALRGRWDDEEVTSALQSVLEAVYPTVVQAEEHARIVLEHAARRRLIRYARDLHREAIDPEADLEDLAERYGLGGFLSGPHSRDRFRFYSLAELEAGDWTVEYLVPDVLVKGQPCVVGAVQKGLKTSIVGVDLSLSLATGTRFLGQWWASESRVCILSGESGMGTLKETAQRIRSARGLKPKDAGDRWMISSDLPTLTDAADVRALRRLVEDRAIDVLIIDPAYLALGMTGSSTANIFEVGGVLLRSLGDLCSQTGCTPILIHHFSGRAVGRYEPPELADLSHAGFAAFARQWILLSRRSRYEHDGRHELWLQCGGSAGHTGLWAVDVEEGLRSDPGGRGWDVSVTPASDQRARAQAARAVEREQAKSDALARDRERILETARRLGPETKTEIKAASGVNTANFGLAWAELVATGRLVKDATVTRDNGREYPAYRTRDNSGQVGTDTGCPEWSTQ